MPESREQVGFSDPEAAIEIQTGRSIRNLLASKEATACGCVVRETLPERTHCLDGLGLRRVVRVGSIGVHGRVHELSRRHEVRHDPLAADGGAPIHEPPAPGIRCALIRCGDGIGRQADYFRRRCAAVAVIATPGVVIQRRVNGSRDTRGFVVRVVSSLTLGIVHTAPPRPRQST